MSFSDECTVWVTSYVYNDVPFLTTDESPAGSAGGTDPQFKPRSAHLVFHFKRSTGVLNILIAPNTLSVNKPDYFPAHLTR